jgi:hypothetical protein
MSSRKWFFGFVTDGPETKPKKKIIKFLKMIKFYENYMVESGFDKSVFSPPFYWLSFVPQKSKSISDAHTWLIFQNCYV